MKHTRSERGFVQMEPFLCTYRTKVRVYESSSAMEPHVWLALEQDDRVLRDAEPGKAHAHLTLPMAQNLRSQLGWLMENHYQVQWDREEEAAAQDGDDRYPFWVNRVGALIWVAEGLVQLFTPWQPTWSLRFYSWWLDRQVQVTGQEGVVR